MSSYSYDSVRNLTKQQRVDRHKVQVKKTEIYEKSYNIESKGNVCNFIAGSRNRKTVYRRKVSGSPRVPFSTEQLLQLEKSYEDTHYITAAKVSQLSAMLKLPGNRIKIWFQNRRAREKKKSKKMTCDGGHQTINDKCVETKVREERQEKINQNIISCPSRFTCPGYERIHPSFSPRFALELQYSTRLNRNGWQSISNLPPTHLSSYFDCGLYKGFRYHA